MSFEAWILLINLKAQSFCNSFLIVDKNCKEEIVDCVLDGEKIEWCKKSYMEKE